MSKEVVNVKIAGLGGMGVLKASDMLADAAFAAGFDVKKSETHGMAQRGGAIASDVRFGRDVLSPMIPDGGTDYLVMLVPEHTDVYRHQLGEGAALLTAEVIDQAALPTRKALNVAMLGLLSRHLDIDEKAWMDAVRANLPEKLHDMNETSFALGRASGEAPDKKSATNQRG